MALNSFAGSAASVISTNSMLASIMTTPSYSTVLATNYVGRDIIGQLGGMAYAWKTGRWADREPLKYITKGSSLEQVGVHLENAVTLLPNGNWTLPFLGLASLTKNVSFISIGAVNAHNLKMISDQNIGQTYSRVASINTLASTAGMLAGIGLLHLVPSYTIRSICVLPLLSGISLYSVRRATKIANEITK